MKYYRLTIYVAGNEVEGEWFEYDVDKFVNDCKLYADNDCMFTVEFRTIGE